MSLLPQVGEKFQLLSSCLKALQCREINWVAMPRAHKTELLASNIPRLTTHGDLLQWCVVSDQPNDCRPQKVNYYFYEAIQRKSPSFRTEVKVVCFYLNPRQHVWLPGGGWIAQGLSVGDQGWRSVGARHAGHGLGFDFYWIASDYHHWLFMDNY